MYGQDMSNEFKDLDLTHLELNISHFESLKGIPRTLETLILHQNSALHDLSELQYCKSLKELHLPQSGHALDLQFLSKNIVKLHLKSRPSSFEPLATCARLQEFVIDPKYVNEEDERYIAHVVRITKVKR